MGAFGLSCSRELSLCAQRLPQGARPSSHHLSAHLARPSSAAFYSKTVPSVALPCTTLIVRYEGQLGISSKVSNGRRAPSRQMRELSMIDRFGLSIQPFAATGWGQVWEPPQSQAVLRRWRPVGRIGLKQVEARAIEVVLVEQRGKTRFEHDAFE